MLAYEVVVPEGYFGGPGGELATACLMYDQFIETQDFVLAKEGRWVNETAENIVC
ncbi:hypothetical protein EJ03DRAFT_323064 [Teratosphaeria nubilosa]|uniref:Uncharacterized protein n=1 Tax=Teratosphaeria nubilosa TaxID=161662 RepID=A0A6G1LNU1_9PEZI|nr:hypothetical protein EJ03DRAFT_323064 [Teratosphaeria nubilosa]